MLTNCSFHRISRFRRTAEVLLGFGVWDANGDVGAPMRISK
jgi:hypothetical protein